jgi:hypothetical protein
MHFYEVLYASIKEEIYFSKVYRLYSFFSWVLVYRSDDGPRNRPKLFAFVINCGVSDGTLFGYIFLI